MRELGDAAEIVKIELLHGSYRFDWPRYDQTLTPIGECGIELILRKRTSQEIADGGRLRRQASSLSREARIHLNQYRDDVARMKKVNVDHPPFTNDDEI